MVESVVDTTNPFVGMRAFEREEKQLFFGRSKQVEDMLAMLRDNRFLAVVGYSGSGKTSIVNCGLIPKLEEGFAAAGGTDWRIATVKLGREPIRNLSDALSQPGVLHDEPRIDPSLPEELERMLKKGGHGLVKVFKKFQLRKGSNLLIYIDQFEDLFVFHEKAKNEGVDQQDNEALIIANLILNAYWEANIPIYFAISVRTDFLDKVADFRTLSTVINDAQFLLPIMTTEDVVAVITQPLENRDKTYEPRLIEHMLHDLDYEEGYLSVLQHTLSRIWENLEDEETKVGLEHYERVGTLKGAMGQQADLLYEKLPEHEKLLCQRIFSILIQNKEGQFTRNFVTFSAILQYTGATTNSVRNLIYTFSSDENGYYIEAPPRNLMNLDARISIADERILREWTKLADWAKEELRAFEMLSQLNIAARGDQSSSDLKTVTLWEGLQFDLGIEWRDKEPKPDEAWASRYPEYSLSTALNFLKRSEDAVNEEIRRQKAAEEEEIRRSKLIARVFAILGLICVALAIVAIYLFIQAEISRRDAERDQELAWSSMLSARESEGRAKGAKLTADSLKDVAIEQQRNAERITKRAIALRKEATEAQRKAEAAKDTIELNQAIADQALKDMKAAKIALEATNVNLVIEQKEKKKALEEARKNAIIAKNRAEESNRLHKKALARSIALNSMVLPDEELKPLLAILAYEVNKKYSDDKAAPAVYAALIDALKKQEGNDFNNFGSTNNLGHHGPVRGLTEPAAKGLLFSCGSDGNIYSRNALEPDELPKLLANEKEVLRSLALSKDEKILAVSGSASGLFVLTLGDDIVKQSFTAHDRQGSNDLVFLPDNTSFFSAGQDGTVVFCDSTSSRLMLKNEHPLNDIAVNKGGFFMALADSSGKVALYNLVGNKMNLRQTKQFDKSVAAVAFNPQAKSLFIGLENGALAVWNYAQDTLTTRLIGHTARINEIRFNKEGNKMATASSDHTCKVWDLDEIRKPGYRPLVLLHDAWVMSAVFMSATPDIDERVLTGTSKGVTAYWDLDSQTLADRLCPQLKRELTEEEWLRYIGESSSLKKEDFNMCSKKEE